MDRRRKPRSSWSRSTTAPEPSDPPAHRPAGGGGSAPSGASGGPRRSRRARGAGTTRRQSAPGRGAAEGPARWSAAPAASHPRRDRCRAGSCAPPRGAGRRRRRRGSRRPPRHRVAPGSRDRYPCPSASGTPVGSGALTGYGCRSGRYDSIFAMRAAEGRRRAGRNEPRLLVRVGAIHRAAGPAQP